MNKTRNLSNPSGCLLIRYESEIVLLYGKVGLAWLGTLYSTGICTIVLTIYYSEQLAEHVKIVT